ncbi:hypothetical protein [Pseudoalteromonas spongiae]|uniref:hypothetical protein n=1 Tax=Pseudoalteromonas spongiae TaxID=298657 RepID=UPI00110B4BC3|nr:hypothetical protein [Pseudoalteromonas spongiae]TMO86408.1 hypothetical protein CWC15_06185 [Pseudoalteromonas spongiae]
MLRNLFTIILFVLFSLCNSLHAKTLKLTYQVLHDDSPYGTGELWISAEATRFDLNIEAQHDMTEVVLFNDRTSSLYKHDSKQHYVLDDKSYKSRVKKQMNWNKSDEEFSQFLLQMERKSGYPRYLEFERHGDTFIAEHEGEQLYIVTPILDGGYSFKADELDLIKYAVVERKKIALAKMGLIDFLPLDVLYMLNEKPQMIFSRYTNKMFALTFKLKSVERLNNTFFLDNLPKNYQTTKR